MLSRLLNNLSKIVGYSSALVLLNEGGQPDMMARLPILPGASIFPSSSITLASIPGNGLPIYPSHPFLFIVFLV
ncbi:MAG: hypothetical protein ACOY30_00285 [Bacillota bacterium]